MLPLATIILAALTALALHRLVHARRLARTMNRHATPTLPDADLPRAAILVGLRGADPDLQSSLTSLLTQNYPEYQVHFVVDSPTDPAWPVVERAIAQTNATHATLTACAHDPADSPVNCTNAKIVQAARTLDPSVHIIAMADADLVPHPDWLRDLATPLLTDPTIGATHGSKWFIPPDDNWGSVTRYAWAAATLPYVAPYDMAWGGCFAIRAETVRRANLIDRWSKVIALDATAPRDLRDLNLSIHCVPSLVMPNRESCSLPFFANYIQRAFTWTRLYHERWPLFLANALASSALLLIALLLVPIAATTAHPTASLVAAAALAIHLTALLATILIADNAVRATLARRNEPATRPSTLRILAALPLFEFIRPLAMLRATFARRIRWRGITLEIRGPHSLRTIATNPMHTAQPTNPRTSL